MVAIREGLSSVGIGVGVAVSVGVGVTLGVGVGVLVGVLVSMIMGISWKLPYTDTRAGDDDTQTRAPSAAMTKKYPPFSLMPIMVKATLGGTDSTIVKFSPGPDRPGSALFASATGVAGVGVAVGVAVSVGVGVKVVVNVSVDVGVELGSGVAVMVGVGVVVAVGLINGIAPMSP